MNFSEIYKEADSAGNEAVAELAVVPMVVQNYDGGKEYFVPDGVCGFAKVVIHNIKFSNFLKKANIGRKNYNGGYMIWISNFGQSMQKKEAYADAFASVLNKYGILAGAESRMD